MLFIFQNSYKPFTDVTDPNQGFGKFYYPTGATYGTYIVYLYLSYAFKKNFLFRYVRKKKKKNYAFLIRCERGVLAYTWPTFMEGDVYGFFHTLVDGRAPDRLGETSKPEITS